MFDMLFNIEERRVGFYETENFKISTVRVTDADKNYETGIKHEDFNDNRYIIVEEYDTFDQAQDGHNEWVQKLINTKSKDLVLKDISSSVWKKLEELSSENEDILPPDEFEELYDDN